LKKTICKLGFMKHSFLKLSQQKKFMSGLTLVEVMVGMLVSGLFLTTSIQAYVSATAMRTQGGSLKEAIGVAQNDMEFIRDQARSLDANNLQIQSCATANGQGYGQRLRETIQDQLAGKPLPSGVTSTTQGSAQVLSVDRTRPDGTPEYRLTRTITVPDNSPTLSKDTVLLAYEVRDIRPTSTPSSVNGAMGGGNSGGGNQSGAAQRDVVVGKFDTAIIPNAALSCP
jgi:Tfp pilus assembly protein PilW